MGIVFYYAVGFHIMSSHDFPNVRMRRKYLIECGEFLRRWYENHVYLDETDTYAIQLPLL